MNMHGIEAELLCHLRFACACFDKFNQLFDVFKIIIIAMDSLAVVDNTSFFVLFQAVQQSFFAIPFGKKCKSMGLDFLQ